MSLICRANAAVSPELGLHDDRTGLKITSRPWMHLAVRVIESSTLPEQYSRYILCIQIVNLWRAAEHYMQVQLTDFLHSIVNHAPG